MDDNMQSNNQPQSQGSQGQQPSQLTDQAAMMSLIDDLLQQRPDIELNDQNRDIVKSNLLAELTAMINSQMIGLLSDEAAQKLEQMLDANVADTELNQFFEAQIPNLETEIAAVLMEFRASFLNVEGNNSNNQSQSSQEDSISPAPVE